MTMPFQDETAPAAVQHISTGAPGDEAPRLALHEWMREGRRAAFFMKPRIGDALPDAWQALLLFGIPQLAYVLVMRLQVRGDALLRYDAWLAALWALPVSLWVMWALLSLTGRARRVTAWFVLGCWASFLPLLLVCAASTLSYRPDVLGALFGAQRVSLVLTVLAYVFWALLVWSWAAGVGVARSFLSGRGSLASFAVASALLFVGSLYLNNGEVWEADDRADVGSRVERPRLILSQELFESQQALWRAQVDALLPQRAGMADVYGLVFAPYGAEDVFMRESHMVRNVLEERFDARGRVLELLNNPSTSETRIWATPLNLRRAVAALAERMDREQDLLVVYLTSHGGQDHKLATSFWPLTMVEPVTAEMLRDALDEAGVRHRVIAVSACYSGGWIAPLENEGTLIMTAADALNTSYGCGSLSPLTYFGRAVFDEQLRATYSFEKAFRAAVPVIRSREQEVGKEDFSNPQISVGARIADVLAGLERRLDAGEEPR